MFFYRANLHFRRHYDFSLVFETTKSTRNAKPLNMATEFCLELSYRPDGDQNDVQCLARIVNTLSILGISGTVPTYGTAYVPTCATAYVQMLPGQIMGNARD